MLKYRLSLAGNDWILLIVLLSSVNARDRVFTWADEIVQFVLHGNKYCLLVFF